MKIYKVKKESHQESSQGFEYWPSLAAAKKALSQFKKQSGSDFNPDSEITVIETGQTKADIINLLNVHGSHNNNG